MKAITIRQPWAWAVMHGGKDVENRSRNIIGSYRGPVAITAGLNDAEDATEADWTPARNQTGHVRRGAVLGVVDIVGVHHVCRCDVEDALCSEWALPESWHIVLASPRPLPTPIPVRGRLGLWTLPTGIDQRIELQLGNVT